MKMMTHYFGDDCDPPHEQHTPEELDRTQQQEDQIQEMRGGLPVCELADPEFCEGPLNSGTGLAKDLWFCYTHRRFGAKMEVEPATDRYTKDLESMLRRIVSSTKTSSVSFAYPSMGKLIAEAKALLERTSYTNDF